MCTFVRAGNARASWGWLASAVCIARCCYRHVGTACCWHHHHSQSRAKQIIKLCPKCALRMLTAAQHRRLFIPHLALRAAALSFAGGRGGRGAACRHQWGCAFGEVEQPGPSPPTSIPA